MVMGKCMTLEACSPKPLPMASYLGSTTKYQQSSVTTSQEVEHAQNRPLEETETTSTEFAQSSLPRITSSVSTEDPESGLPHVTSSLSRSTESRGLKPTSRIHITSRTQSSIGSTCELQDEFCSFRGSDHAMDGFRDVCVLWNSSCSGNTTLAAHKFWPKTSELVYNSCFQRPSPACTKSNPAERMSAFAEVKNWMRSRQCFVLSHDVFPDPNHDAQLQNALFLNGTCCNSCQVLVDKVDVYFWPQPNANTSCQSIIGDEVSSVADGATTDDMGNVYWGCTASLIPGDVKGTNPFTVITTATLTSIASLQFKTYSYNPWDDSPCGDSSSSSGLNATATHHNDRSGSLVPRAHSLLATNDASTVVVGSHTL